MQRRPIPTEEAFVLLDVENGQYLESYRPTVVLDAMIAEGVFHTYE